jgi:multidrug efflux pump subunit AcrA (membrane-fusion protein)
VFKRHFILLLPLFLLVSCQSDPNEERLLYTVVRKNFENILYVSGTVEPLHSTTLSAPSVPSGTLTFMVEDGTFVDKGEVVCVIEVGELANRYDELLLEIENARASLNKTRADLQMQYALLEAQVRSNEAGTRIAQLDSLQLTYSTPNQRRITELELESALIERNKLKEKLKALEVIQQTDLKGREYRLERRMRQAEEVKQELASLTLRAPHAGLAMRGDSWVTDEKFLVGDAVYGGQPVVTIPDLGAMKVIIKASESDYKTIDAGDSVHYRFDAMPGGDAWGRIVQKSPVGQPIRRNSTVKVYEIEASVDSVVRMPEPGFSVGCRVTLDEVRDTLVIPQVAVFDQDSMRVVYIPLKRGCEMREIRTGRASPKEVIVVEGLAEGERVLLIRPEESRIKRITRLPARPPAPAAPAEAERTEPAESAGKTEETTETEIIL